MIACSVQEMSLEHMHFCNQQPQTTAKPHGMSDLPAATSWPDAVPPDTFPLLVSPVWRLSTEPLLEGAVPVLGVTWELLDWLLGPPCCSAPLAWHSSAISITLPADCESICASANSVCSSKAPVRACTRSLKDSCCHVLPTVSNALWCTMPGNVVLASITPKAAGVHRVWDAGACWEPHKTAYAAEVAANPPLCALLSRPVQERLNQPSGQALT